MTIQEFDDLKIGDTCLVTRGKDKGKRCIVLYKAGHTIKYDHRIGIVVVKPEDYGNLFESSTLTCRYFKLFSHTELKDLILIGEGPAETRALSFYIYAETAAAFMEVIAL